MPRPGSQSLEFMERLYADYLGDPASVSDDWRGYFQRLTDGDLALRRPRLGPSFRPASVFNPTSTGRETGRAVSTESRAAHLQDRVNQLIRNYRVRGHMIAAIDPLERPCPSPPELDPAFLGLTEADLDHRVDCEAFPYDGPLTIRELLQRLRNTYCRFIGVQYMHIADLAVRRWLQQRMESTQNHLSLARQDQLRILTRLSDAVTFEEFIRKKYIGAKTFSLEGCESLIPLLDLAIEKAGSQGVREIVLGMAHRGRLNVLANVIGKSPRQIFREFEDSDPGLYLGRGDVKYHLGHSGDWMTAGGERVHLSLCFNPSHLEFVNPVVMGRVRAKLDRAGDEEGRLCLPLIIHGDASFPGEGVVQETLNLSRLQAYQVGGTLHVIVNNQIGFTTSPQESRSSLYATGVAQMLEVPIFHVNGENPEAVAQVVRLALDFRAAYRRDVFIDMYGYRRLGHNEGDEPSFTQPALYRAISQRKSVLEGYLDHLLQLDGVTREEADAIAADRRQRLEEDLSQAREKDYQAPAERPLGIWSRSDYLGGPDSEVEEVATGVERPRLVNLLEALTRLPEEFHAHPKISKILETRLDMARGKHPLDWSTAEALAFASVARDGQRVRLSGQDSGRGTFSQRHAILYDYKTGGAYLPLQHLDPALAPVQIINSPLSEAAVLGFEYGYSLDYPDGLVLWEAQFGDFANAAQVITDQFIAAAEDKWRRLSGLVLLLPHGFEGQGPEHSSARLERFLTLAAEDNIQVVSPSTPAQYFHCLRRQVHRRWRKPLVVMTPKSLLRHPAAVSSLEECARGKFERLLPDRLHGRHSKPIRSVLLCSGKIYYELAERREARNAWDVAIIRLEQLYPFPHSQLEAALANYRKGTPVRWVQEEPENMGAWRFLHALLGETLEERFAFSGLYRPASASPASGSASSHKKEQQELIEAALARPQASARSHSSPRKRKPHVHRTKNSRGR
jgi:2-oxoglutarate dehydrogenase E1 component